MHFRRYNYEGLNKNLMVKASVLTMRKIAKFIEKSLKEESNLKHKKRRKYLQTIQHDFKITIETSSKGKEDLITSLKGREREKNESYAKKMKARTFLYIKKLLKKKFEVVNENEKIKKNKYNVEKQNEERVFDKTMEELFKLYPKDGFETEEHAHIRQKRYEFFFREYRRSEQFIDDAIKAYKKDVSGLDKYLKFARDYLSYIGKEKVDEDSAYLSKEWDKVLKRKEQNLVKKEEKEICSAYYHLRETLNDDASYTKEYAISQLETGPQSGPKAKQEPLINDPMLTSECPQNGYDGQEEDFSCTSLYENLHHSRPYDKEESGFF